MNKISIASSIGWEHSSTNYSILKSRSSEFILGNNHKQNLLLKEGSTHIVRGNRRIITEVTLLGLTVSKSIS